MARQGGHGGVPPPRAGAYRCGRPVAYPGGALRGVAAAARGGPKPVPVVGGCRDPPRRPGPCRSHQLATASAGDGGSSRAQWRGALPHVAALDPPRWPRRPPAAATRPRRRRSAAAVPNAAADVARYAAAAAAASATSSRGRYPTVRTSSSVSARTSGAPARLRAAGVAAATAGVAGRVSQSRSAAAWKRAPPTSCTASIATPDRDTRPTKKVATMAAAE